MGNQEAQLAAAVAEGLRINEARRNKNALIILGVLLLVVIAAGWFFSRDSYGRALQASRERTAAHP